VPVKEIHCWPYFRQFCWLAWLLNLELQIQSCYFFPGMLFIANAILLLQGGIFLFAESGIFLFADF